MKKQHKKEMDKQREEHSENTQDFLADWKRINKNPQSLKDVPPKDKNRKT